MKSKGDIWLHDEEVQVGCGVSASGEKYRVQASRQSKKNGCLGFALADGFLCSSTVKESEKESTNTQYLELLIVCGC